MEANNVISFGEASLTLIRAAERVDGISSRLSHRVSLASRDHSDAISLILSDLAKYRLDFINQARARLAKRSAWSDKHREEVLAGEKALLASVRVIDSGILDVGELCHDVKGVLGLLEACELPRQSGVICCDPVAVADVFSVVLASSWIQSSIDTSRGVLSGSGISWCMPGHTPAALDHNAVALHCCDDRGEAVRGLSADDFNADVRVIGVPGLIGPPTVSAPTLDSDGNRVTFQYSIPDLGKDVLSADSSVQISVRYFSQEAACAIVKIPHGIRGEVQKSMEIVPAVLTPSGIAVDTHERFLAISDARKLTVSLYSLPDCLHVRTVGCGVVTEFKEPRKMCFATNGDLLIADNTKQRVQVLSADLSIHRRNIGVGVIDGWIAGLTSNDTLIATCKSGSGRQIQMFDVETGDPVRSFCACGANFGQLNDCYGIRFMPDGLHLIVAERAAERLSIFTVEGQFVRVLQLSFQPSEPWDVDFAGNGDIIIAVGHKPEKKSAGVIVLTSDVDSEIALEFKQETRVTVASGSVCALAVRGPNVYALGNSAPIRVYVLQ